MSDSPSWSPESLYDVNEQFYEPKSLVLEITRQCTEACTHCVVAASPRRRERLSLPQMEMAMNDARRNGFVSVSFYGGEPFVAKDDLYKAVAMAYAHHLQPQIMSNGFWGRTQESAHDVFNKLAEVQPNGDIAPISINLSTDEFHLKVPHESLGNIIAAWAARPERIDLNLAIGNSGKEDGVQAALTAILDAADAALEGSGMRTCDRHAHVMLGGGYSIGILDKFLSIDLSTDPATLIALLEQEQMVQDDAIRFLRGREFPNAKEVIRLIEANDWMKVVQDENDHAQGKFRAGRYKDQKQMQFRGYSINLFGAGRALQNDSALLERIATARSKSSRDVNAHEYDSLLLLGSDNRYYASPIHLQHAVRPLGENDGSAISNIIDVVNDGETISNILRLQDTSTAKMFLVAAEDFAAYERFCDLETKGLIHEAMEVFLLSKAAIEQLPETWSLYRRG